MSGLKLMQLVWLWGNILGQGGETPQVRYWTAVG